MTSTLERLGARTLAGAAVLAACLAASVSAAPPAPPRPTAEEREQLIRAHARPPHGFLPPRVFAGQSDIDVLGYDLTVIPDMWEPRLQGVVKVTFQPAPGVGEVRDLVLDLDDAMVVAADGVLRDAVPGIPLPFTHAGGELRIDLAAWSGPVVMGTTETVTIPYAGRPNQDGGIGLQFSERVTATTRTPSIFSLSEPFAARRWWPCKDQPSDKATVTVRIETPADLTAVSNGSLVGVFPASRDGNVVTVWRERSPIATYLVSVAIGAYATCESRYVSPLNAAREVPVIHWVWEQDLQRACELWSAVPDMMSEFARRFGEYPFLYDKYGHVAVQPAAPNSIYVAMENQTCSTIGSGWVNLPQDWLSAHELAHQWWGNSVTPADFDSIWLNEGFASWAEAAWTESRSGLVEYLAYMRDLDPILRSGEFAGPVHDPIDADADGWPDGDGTGAELTVYNKGAWVVHMLRWVLSQTSIDGNPERLYDSLQAWSTERAGGTARTADFTTFMDRRATDLYGMRDGLGWFFDQWLYRDDRPCYRVGWTATPRDGGLWAVQVQVEQGEWGWDPNLEQRTCVGEMATPYRMPVDVRISLAGGNVVNHLVDSREAVQAFEFLVQERPQVVAWDPDGWILKIVRSKNMDTDGDGWVDLLDACPFVPDPTQADVDADGRADACQPGLDVDGDGIVNEDDCAPADPSAWTSPAAATFPPVRVSKSATGLVLHYEMPAAGAPAERPWVVDVGRGRLERLRPNGGAFLDAACVETGRSVAGEVVVPWADLAVNAYVVALPYNGCQQPSPQGLPDDPCR